jgi:hypothetical protein
MENNSKDYYILKKLKLEYINRIEYINISIEKCYDNDIDSDDDKYFEKVFNKYLKVSMDPILLYVNNNWIKDIFYYKYDKLIKDKNGLKKILKIEERKFK